MKSLGRINDQYWYNEQGHNCYRTVRDSTYREHKPDGLWFFRTTVDLRPITKRKTHVTEVMLDEFPQGRVFNGYCGFDNHSTRPDGPHSRLFYRYECEASKEDDYKNKGALYFAYGSIVVVWEVAL